MGEKAGVEPTLLVDTWWMPRVSEASAGVVVLLDPYSSAPPWSIFSRKSEDTAFTHVLAHRERRSFLHRAGFWSRTRWLVSIEGCRASATSIEAG